MYSLLFIISINATYTGFPDYPYPFASFSIKNTIIFKVSLKINDKLQFHQTFYAEHWATVNPDGFATPTRPVETLQHSRGNLALAYVLYNRQAGFRDNLPDSPDHFNRLAARGDLGGVCVEPV